jgi:hypothetical protein
MLGLFYGVGIFQELGDARTVIKDAAWNLGVIWVWEWLMGMGT